MRRRGCGAAFAVVLLALAWEFSMVSAAWGACRPRTMVRDFPAASVRLASFAVAAETGAARADVTVEWFGHSFFRLTSKSDTRIVTDPLAPGMYPTPKISAHAVTVGREHRNHNAVEIVEGNPGVLRGLTEFGAEWRRVQTQVREVEIRSIPVYHTGYETGPMKGAAFTYNFGRVCVAHLGDLAGLLTPRQLEELGRVDVLLIPIGGRFTMSPDVAQKVLHQVQPRVAIPMHYWDREDLLMAFLNGLRHRRHNSSVISFSRETLPRQMTVIVLRSSA